MASLEEVAGYPLDEEQRERLFALQRVCSVCWSTSDGWPVGVTHRYIWWGGRIWVTTSRQRVRVKALEARPKSCVIISGDGTEMGPDCTMTIKTTAKVHDDRETLEIAPDPHGLRARSHTGRVPGHDFRVARVVTRGHPGRPTDADNTFQAGFLGNFWKSPMTFSPPNQPKMPFECAEAAFQACKWWGRASEFSLLDGEEAFKLKRKLEGQGSDFTYGGFGNNWKAMMGVLEAKFDPGCVCCCVCVRV